VGKKEVRYLNRDFSQFRDSLISFAKAYFPNTYQNFNESSVGMMFIEMASYVGDTLSYYTDNALKESLLLYAEEEQNIYALAQTLGYRPALSFPAFTNVDVFQIVPAAGTGADVAPNYNYALVINSGMQIQSDGNSDVFFRTLSDINFAYSSSDDLTDVAIFETDDSGNVTFFVLKKSVRVSAGEIKTATFSFSEATRFETRVLPDPNIIEILHATDSDGNRWHHVPYLAQDTVFTELKNVEAIDKDLAQYNDTAPYLLKLQKTARRFTSRIRGDRSIELQFGAGVSDDADELLIPNPTNVGSNVFGSVTFTDNPIDPSNFLHTKTYGQAPHNTTLTVKYVTGGGLSSNVNQNDLVKITGAEYTIDEDALDSDITRQVKDSVATNNPTAANGGRDGESVEEVRQNALANFPTQLRAVTKEDYIVRTYSMPPRYGRVAKSYILQDDQLANSPDTVGGEGKRRPNPLALNLYVLGYNNRKQLVTLNDAIKENLKVYLGQYRMLTDAINIKDGFVVNIGINFTIIVFKNYNKREVLLYCIDKLKAMFNIERWQFNQPIIISDIQTELFSVEGVQSVVSTEIVNKWNIDEGYSGNVYDINSATKDGVVYPSLDPCIFEIKYPTQDISGRSL